MLKRFERLNTDKIIQDSITDNAEAMGELNKKQLYTGKDKTGEFLRPYRSQLYADIKYQMNPVPGYGNPDLRVTGAFYRGIQVKVSGDSINIKSTDEKGEALEKKYGAEIFGLGKELKKEFLDEKLRPAIKEKILQETGLLMKS